jgi:hypothetical protein
MALTGRWVSAGSVTRDLPDANLIALPDGGALLVGIETEERGDQSYTRMATERWEPGSGTWQPTGGLPKMRSSFVSVPVTDGRVLVAGGYNEVDASYSSAYIFDLASETWTKTGLMTVARTHPGAAVLPDGRVLVVGGYFYAPEAFSAPPPSETRRAGAVLAAWTAPVPHGRATRRAPFYDIDAPPIGRALATAELFDPATGEWTPTGSMRYARSGPAITTLVDGRVLVVGSSPDNVRVDDRAYGTAEVYDPATGRFTSMGSLPDIDRAAISGLGIDLPEDAPTSGVTGSLVALRDGGAVLVGHQGWWKHEAEVVRSFRLDPRDAAWRDTGTPYAWTGGEMPTDDTGTVSRLDAVVAPLGDGSVMVASGSIGGETGWGEGARPPQSVERYDPAVDAWSRLPDLPEARISPHGITLADGSVLVVGGHVRVGSGEDMMSQWARQTYRFEPD